MVAFDPERDLAVLRVRNLRLFALPFADGGVGTTGAVFGHPGGGPLRIAPARIAETVNAAGTDIYRTGRTSRRVHVLAAELAPGDSGGPLVDQQGRMVGVAFAIDPGQESTAYALTRGEVDAVLGPYTSALNDYVRRELEYESDLPYEVMSETVHENWDYEDFKNAHVDVSETLRETMSRNPSLSSTSSTATAMVWVTPVRFR